MKKYSKVLGYTWDNMVIMLTIEDGRIGLPIVSKDEDFTLEDDNCSWVSSKERTRSSLRMRMPVQGEDPDGYVIAGMDSKTLSLFLDQIKSCAYMLHEIYYIDDRVTDSDSRCPESVRKLWKESLILRSSTPRPATSARRTPRRSSACRWRAPTSAAPSCRRSSA